jgi:hypothetical protein
MPDGLWAGARTAAVYAPIPRIHDPHHSTPSRQGRSASSLLLPACSERVTAPQSVNRVSTRHPGARLSSSAPRSRLDLCLAFSTSGAFVESGMVVTAADRQRAAVSVRRGQPPDAAIRGQQGTFTIRTQIIETVTEDEHIFANEALGPSLVEPGPTRPSTVPETWKGRSMTRRI